MARILVVDDDAELVDATRAVLESSAHVVSVAGNGEEGYRKAVAEKPELIILDVMMTTDTEGFDIVRRLQENGDTRNLPVLLVTGIKRVKHLPFSFEPDQDWLPVKAVLDKPVRPDVLLSAVEKAIGK